MENFILIETFKKSSNEGNRKMLYYWRDNKGLEIDLIMENEESQISPVEIKSSKTNSEFLVITL